MNDQALLRSLRKINGMDLRSIKRTIGQIRNLGVDPCPDDLEKEMSDLCFWRTKRRENRSEILKLQRGVF